MTEVGRNADVTVCHFCTEAILVLSNLLRNALFRIGPVNANAVQSIFFKP